VNEMKIPDESDWENYWDDLDTKYAYKQFFGKSNEEMQPYFEENVMLFSEDIYWMPIKPFQYYIFGFRDFVLTKAFRLDSFGSDAASIYLGVILDHLEKNPSFVTPIFDQLKESIDYVAKNQVLYDANEEIYGSFIELRERIYQLAGQNGSV
jgi:hypothetical protein